jgi:hypothetical protein
MEPATLVFMKSPSAYRYCGKKVAHSRQQAAKVARTLAAFYYKCPKCLAWHITRQPPLKPSQATEELFCK